MTSLHIEEKLKPEGIGVGNVFLVFSLSVCASLCFTVLPAYHLSDKLQRVGQGHTEREVFIPSGKCYIFPMTQRREAQTEASSFWSFPKNTLLDYCSV